MTRAPFPKKGKTADSKPANSWFQDITTAADTIFTTIDGTTNEIDTSGTAPTATIGLADDAVFPGTSGVQVPSGTSAQRAVSPADGTIRYNTDNGQLEFRINSIWEPHGKTPVSATQTQNEGAGITTAYVSPGRQHFHPGHPKAWVVMNETGTTDISDSYNISSVTDSATGEYTVTFDITMSNATYGVSGMAGWDSSTGNTILSFNVRAAGSVSMKLRDAGGTTRDEDAVVIIYGELA